jgi:copper(I)-binding protein
MNIKLLTFLATSSLVMCVASAQAEITVRDAWVRATPGAAKVTSGYAVLSNSGPEDDVLISVQTPTATMAHLHASADTDGVMRMEGVKELTVPAGKDVALAPGGYHVMVMNLATSLKTGEEIPLIFSFKKQGAVKVMAKVMPLAFGGGPLPKTSHPDHH